MPGSCCQTVSGTNRWRGTARKVCCHGGVRALSAARCATKRSSSCVARAVINGRQTRRASCYGRWDPIRGVSSMPGTYTCQRSGSPGHGKATSRCPEALASRSAADRLRTARWSQRPHLGAVLYRSHGLIFCRSLHSLGGVLCVYRPYRSCGPPRGRPPCPRWSTHPRVVEIIELLSVARSGHRPKRAAMRR
jgi:hypothetical protein